MLWIWVLFDQVHDRVSWKVEGWDLEFALISYLLTQCMVGVFCTKSKHCILPKSVSIIDLLPAIAVEKHFCGVFLPVTKYYAVVVPAESGVCTWGTVSDESSLVCSKTAVSLQFVVLLTLGWWKGTAFQWVAQCSSASELTDALSCLVLLGEALRDSNYSSRRW